MAKDNRHPVLDMGSGAMDSFNQPRSGRLGGPSCLKFRSYRKTGQLINLKMGTILALGLFVFSSALFAGPTYLGDKSAQLHFSFATSVGVVEGYIPIRSLEVKGPRGIGEFLFKIVVEPGRINTGDKLLDRLIEEISLQGKQRLTLHATQRIRPKWRPPAEPKDLPKASAFLDSTKRRVYIEIPYTWNTIDSNSAKMSFSYEIDHKRLGFKDVRHPFAQMKGPIQFRFEGVLKRQDS